MRRLIINADDLGYSPGITRGIIEAHTRGIVTSTTLMVNLPYARAAFEQAQAYPELGTGIHLNLTAGPSLSRDPALVNADGNLQYSNVLRLGRIPMKAIEAELRAQIERFLKWGGTPTHLDSHLGFHLAAVVRPVVLKLANEYGIRAIRSAGANIPGAISRLELATHGLFLFGRLILKRDLMRTQIERMRAEISAAGILQTDGFLMGHWFGSNGSISSARQLVRRLIALLPDGTYEVLFHPGYIDRFLPGRDLLWKRREYERIALTDPDIRVAIDNRGIQLVHYGQLICTEAQEDKEELSFLSF